MPIEYKINPQVTNEDLNSLFTDAWPGPHEERDFLRVLERSLAYVCAYHNGELVGFVNVAWDGGAHAFLLDSTVRSDMRHQGIGLTLVRNAEEEARRAGAEWLHVDYEPELAEFYQKCGFRDTKAGLIRLTE